MYFRKIYRFAVYNIATRVTLIYHEAVHLRRVMRNYTLFRLDGRRIVSCHRHAATTSANTITPTFPASIHR